MRDGIAKMVAWFLRRTFVSIDTMAFWLSYFTYFDVDGKGLVGSCFWIFGWWIGRNHAWSMKVVGNES